jgi:hypothetical protein
MIADNQVRKRQAIVSAKRRVLVKAMGWRVVLAKVRVRWLRMDVPIVG